MIIPAETIKLKDMKEYVFAFSNKDYYSPDLFPSGAC